MQKYRGRQYIADKSQSDYLIYMSSSALHTDTQNPAADELGTPQINFLFSPGNAWAQMYADCKLATKSICFEQYIIANDAVGHRFIDLFIQKAKAGVQIRLVIDSIGSHSLESSHIIQELKQAGGQVIIFNHKSFWHILFPMTWLPRNHAKTMIIDARIAYVGSVCLAAEMENWRDLHARMTGTIVADIQNDFDALWQQLKAAHTPHHRQRNRRYAHFEPATTGKSLRYVVHKPELQTNELYKELLEQIAKAQDYIFMATPYFLPPRRLRVGLSKASARGVKVVILLSNATDVPLADKVGRSFFVKLLRRGIKMYLYPLSVMHAKYSIIDGQWATIGSTNLDYLSLLHNRETNLVIEDKEVIERLRAHFITDMEASLVATPESWTGMPLLYRLVGKAGRAIRQLM